jgi:hypothetical protein
MTHHTLTNLANLPTSPSVLPNALPSPQRRALLELSLGLGTVALLQACGGGGGGGGDAPPPGLASKTWQGAALLDSGNTGSAEQPAIAFDGQGNAMAVWCQLDPASMGGKRSIWARHYSASTGWGAAGRIEADDAQNGRLPQVAMDASGNAVALWAWLDANGVDTNIVANRYAAGTGAGSGWGTPVPLELADQKPDRFQVAVNASGNAVVVWEQYDGVRNNIRASRFIAGTGAGTGWSPAQPIETTEGDARQPRVVLAASGHAMAVWKQAVGSSDYILASRYSPITGWGSPSPISRAGNAFTLPQLAVDAAGNAMAIWFENTTQVWTNRYSAGQWGTAVLLETVNASNAQSQMAMASSGMATAVWQAREASTGDYVVHASHTSSATGPWSSPVPLNAPGTSVSTARPQVATDANGNALAVWEQAGPNDVTQLWASRYLASANAWSRPERLDQATAAVEAPQIAMDANGNAIAVWTQFTPVGAATRADVVYNLLR